MVRELDAAPAARPAGFGRAGVADEQQFGIEIEDPPWQAIRAVPPGLRTRRISANISACSLALRY
jgi:hypothetical protein